MPESQPPVLRRGLILAAFLGLAVVVGLNGRAITDTLFRGLEWSRQLGPLSYVVLTLAYALACVFLIPNAILAMSIGWMLGPVAGTIVSLLGSALGGTVNYLIAGRLGRNWFDQRVAASPRFRAVEIACRTRGFQIVLLTRLTPVFHSNIMSYFFGVTRVPLRAFVVATVIGLLPRTLASTLTGAAAKSLADLQQSGHGLADQPLTAYLPYIFVVLAVIALIYIGWVSTVALREALDEAQAEAASQPIPGEPGASATGDRRTSGR
ncbi:MAG: TVP38/TMEM64 family protein [Planctomycetaceae bacterium]|nr:TVP38/TMEM64 family protein [Planctomycetaceae bacterium]